jgi:hypothetical protein
MLPVYAGEHYSSALPLQSVMKSTLFTAWCRIKGSDNTRPATEPGPYTHTDDNSNRKENIITGTLTGPSPTGREQDKIKTFKIFFFARKEMKISLRTKRKKWTNKEWIK